MVCKVMAERGRCLIGVDVGTTAVKAVAVDECCQLLAEARLPLNIYSPSRGIFTHDAGEIRDKMFESLRLLMKKLDGRRVEAVGVTAQSVSLVLLDRLGNPVYPVLSHLDKRADLAAEEMEGSQGYIGRKLVGNLVWLRRHEPNVYAKISKVLDMKEYAGYLLTGRTSVDKLWFMVEDLERLCLDAGINPSLLGEVQTYTDVLGYVDDDAAKRASLKPGVPVVVALGDSLAAMIGSGVVEEGEMVDVAGATEVMATLVKEKTPHSYPSYISGLYMMSVSPPLGLMHKWLVEKISPNSDYTYFERLAEHAPPGAEGLMFVADGWKMTKDVWGSLVNLTYCHGWNHVARSFFEAVAYELRRVVEIFEQVTKVRRIVSSGGGATGFVTKLKATVVGKPFQIPEIRETAALGAALTAATATGLFKNLAEAASSIKIAETIHGESQPIYDELYRRYLATRNRLGTEG